MNKTLYADLRECVRNFTSLTAERFKETYDTSVISIHILSTLVHLDLLQYPPPLPCTCHSQSLLLHSKLQALQLCLLIDFIMLATFLFSLKPLHLRKPIIRSYNRQQSYSPYVFSPNFVEFQYLTFE